MTWLVPAADLLREPDPGPTPFLVDGLLVDPSIAAIIAPPKAGKSWLAIELAVSVATGSPALGYLPARQGPVLLIAEESTRRSMHRRIKMLARGRGIEPNQLEHLHISANTGVQLVDSGGFAKVGIPQLREAIKRINPVLVILDPIVRMKGLGTDENSQKEMAEVFDGLLGLKNDGECTVAFVHHTGHNTSRPRGTSDFDALWESKISLRRKGETCTINAEHRDAEAIEPIEYRLAFDKLTSSLRLETDRDRLDEHDLLILQHLSEYPGSTREEVRKAVPKRASGTSSRLESLEAAGTVYRTPSQRPDGAGRPRTVDTFYLSPDAGSYPVPDSGTSGTSDEADRCVVPPSRPIRPDGGRTAHAGGGK